HEHVGTGGAERDDGVLQRRGDGVDVGGRAEDVVAAADERDQVGPRVESDVELLGDDRAQLASPDRQVRVLQRLLARRDAAGGEGRGEVVGPAALDVGRVRVGVPQALREGVAHGDVARPADGRRRGGVGRGAFRFRGRGGHGPYCRAPRRPSTRYRSDQGCERWHRLSVSVGPGNLLDVETTGNPTPPAGAAAAPGVQPLSQVTAPDWTEALADVSMNVRAMGDFLRAEVAAGRTYVPAGENVLAAFQRPLGEVRVLVVGQDPYPTPGHAMGLSFSVQPDVRPVPRSLANIYT